MTTFVKIFLIAAIIFVILAVVFSIFPNMPHFPGDSFYTRENFIFHFPLLTCGIISGIIAGILFFTKKL